MIRISDNEFRLLKDFIQKTSGIAVPKEKQYLFVTRLSNLLVELGCTNFSEFYFMLTHKQDPILRNRLVDAITTKETGFFRDEHPFKALVERIFPEMSEHKIQRTQFMPPRIRIWSVGCSTGEEPYSVAMAVKEWLDTQKSFSVNDVSITAGDISKSALSKAKQAVFDERCVTKKVPNTYRQKYFSKLGDKYRVKEEIRAMIVFADLNLNGSFQQIGDFDLILCRNVIIYFDTDLKRNIVDKFYDLLEPGGVLIMGASENLYNLSNKFESVQSGPTIYYRKER